MRVLWISAFVIVVDQTTKWFVLQTMQRGESIPVIGHWLKFTFTENPGMAFGITVGPPGMITIFSILATALILAYLWRLGTVYMPYRVSLALLLGGALGNIIDRVFYGMWFGDRGLFLGHVVDFIHVNLWRGFVPEYVPFIGGSYMALFPIWNVADMAIVGGVLGILFFQGRFHDEALRGPEVADSKGYPLHTQSLPPGQQNAERPSEDADRSVSTVEKR